MSDGLVPAVPPQSWASMQSLAADFVRDWAPERQTAPGAFPVFDVFEDLRERHPQLVTGAANLPAGVEGVCCPDGRVLVSEMTYRRLVAGDGRARFTTVHEICHGLHHRAYLKRALVEGQGERILNP